MNARIRSRNAALKTAVALAVAVTSHSTPFAQTKHPPAPSEWGQFESLAIQFRGGLSPDGKWLAYGINRSSRENELRIRDVEAGTEHTVAFGAQPTYSADSEWIAYSIGYSETQEERMRAQRRPIHRKLGLLKLDGTSEPVVIDGIESFAFDPSGKYLAMRRYAPERPSGSGSTPSTAPSGGAASAPQRSADEPAPTGVTILVRKLENGVDTTFGNVAEFAWPNVTDPSKLKKPLLALTISTEDKTGNGIHLFDAATGLHRVLDSSASIYSNLAWRRDADDLAVLRSHSDEKRDGSTHTVLAWTAAASDSPEARTLDPLKSVPAGMRTVSFRRPSWSDDGKVVFVGIGTWEEKPPAEKKAEPAADGASRPAPADDMPTVEIWHAKDVDVMPRQKVNARAERQRNLLAAWHLESGQLVQLARGNNEQVVPIRRQSLAYVAQWEAYALDRTIGRRAADIALVDLRTGDRTDLVSRIDDAYLQTSPKGRFLLFFRDDHYWTVNTATKAVINITKAAPTSFVDRESDVTVKQKPAFGVAGWTTDDEAVLLYDKFDVWEVAVDGSRARRLTDGAAEQVRHRVVRFDPNEEWIDTSKPITFSLFGVWSKKSGYARRAPSGQVERLIFEDRAISNLTKARDADVYLYVTQRFDDSPDAYVGGPMLAEAKQVTNTNPFMTKYAWGRSEIVEFKNDRGVRLQGSLHYPANYVPGKKYPMVVYLYEKLSDNVHQFIAPSERDYYNETAFTSQGYLFFQPDIVFRPREPGLSVIECVEPALKKVIAMGVADPARIGVVGHSWGGFDASYLATHSNMFAAAVAGAAITNLVSNYGNHHWSSGIAETDHIETGQQRMEVPLYEDLEAYIRNSAVFNVHNMKTPLLLEVGDNDGTVHWHQGVELYNLARRAKKDVVMLAYGGEDHGLRRRANQIDYHRRILQWFGHYLKSEPAAPWITSGLRYIDRDNELKKKG